MSDKRMKVYISGPMTGIEDFNHPAFDAMAAALEARGFEAVNPVDVCQHLDHDKHTWADYMRPNIKAMMDCDGILLLEGWTSSRGARLEHAIALGLKMFRVRELPSGDFSWMQMG